MESLEHIDGQEMDPAEKINDARSLEELYRVIEEIGEVKGTREIPYTPNELMGTIELVRMGGSIRSITNAYGLRNKVKNLLIADAGNFDKLYATLVQIEEVPGTERQFQANELIAIIKAARGGLAGITAIPNTIVHVRDKVRELLEQDSSSQKE